MKGILFKPDMIQAIVEGRKTQTRRVIKPQPLVAPSTPNHAAFLDVPNSRYRVGETVYIKEGLRRKRNDPSMPCDYVTYLTDLTGVSRMAIDEKYDQFGRASWRWERDTVNPMFMPEWAARHFIVIEGVKAERLQEITPEDCVAEGYPLGAIPEGRDEKQLLISRQARIGWYQILWDSINPKYPWESNPWVWVYTFRSGK